MRILIRARNRTIAIEGDRIAPAEGAFDLVIRAPDADLSPGLINAHDHLHRNHFGRLGAPPYANAADWGRDVERRSRDHIARCRARTSRREALLAGAWKNLLAGVTSVVHHDPWEDDFEDDFPLRVVRIANCQSIAAPSDLAALAEEPGPIMLHVAEGVDAAAARELREIDRLGLLGPRLLAVHCLGLDRRGAERFRQSGAALVWCPTSNRYLFGRTAPARLFDRGCDVLLGSDSLLSGDGDLLDELRAARALGLLDDRRLEEAVGKVAARRLNLPEPTLEPGSRGDVVLLRAPLLEARSSDVALVVANGVPRVADAEIARQLGRLAHRGCRMATRGGIRWAASPPASSDRMLTCA